MALFIFSKRFFVHWDEKKATPFFKFYHCSNDMGSCSSRAVPNSLQHNTTTYWTMSNEISSQWLLSIYFIVVQVTLLTSTWSLYFNFKYQFYFGKKIFLYLQFTISSLDYKKLFHIQFQVDSINSIFLFLC